jgi:lipopolysaccharide export system ATP-binding protein
VLDDILTLFRRRRRVPARRASPAGNSRLSMNLDTMGGPIYRTRSDAIPQVEAVPERRASPRPEQARQPRPEPQPPQQREARSDPRPDLPPQECRAHQPAEQRSRRGEAPRPPAAPKKSSLSAQAAKAARHVAEHGHYLAAHAVEKTFGNRKVVKGASLYVRRGEAVGLLGPNGAGKTTIFYMITGLIKADVGRIELDGYDVTALPMYQRARLGIGYLPQEASIFRGLNVEENLRAVLEVVEPSKRKREQQLTSLLEEFHIERLRKTPTIALSGGERRRVEIARALATRPNYMLLDEPFAGIDPIAVGDIQQLVRHLTNRGIGVLITDHNVRETLGLTDRAYIIYSGEVLMEGRTEDIVNNPEVRRVYLGAEFKL